MLSSNKKILIGSFLLIFFILIGSVAATEDVSIPDNLSYEDSQNTIQSTEMDEITQSDVDNDEKLQDTDSKSNEIFINPDFEDENVVLNTAGNVYGWNVSTLGGKDASPQPTGRIINVDGNNVLFIERSSNIAEKISQKNIDFTYVKSISFKLFNKDFTQQTEDTLKLYESLTPEQIQQMGTTEEDVQNILNSYIMTFTITMGDNTTTKDTVRSVGWQEINIDTSDIVGVGLFEISMPQASISAGVKNIYFDDFIAELDVDKLINDLAEVNKKVNNLTSQLADAQANNTKLANDLVDAQANNTKLANDLVDAQANNTKLANDLVDAQANNTKLANDLVDAQANNTKLAGNLAEANKKVDSLTSQLNSKVVVIKKATTITAPKKTFKVKAKSKKISITLKSNGKAVKGKKVTITIKGKTYSAKTNSKGIATIKVKLTKKGTYKYTAKFAGDNTYKAISKKGSIKVK